LDDLIGKFEIPLCKTFPGKCDHFVNIVFLLPYGDDLRIVETGGIPLEKHFFRLS
jgi:hypothetical protein